jgi:hypothetical protein
MGSRILFVRVGGWRAVRRRVADSMDDRELWRKYADDGDEAAFGQHWWWVVPVVRQQLG